ncbi:MAG: hypothetical protein AB1806_06385, partial [Acidobacteriota bacterium]
AELKTDMVTVKADVAELKTDMVTVKADVAELKTDMVTVKADVAELKVGQSALAETVHQVLVLAEHQAQQLRLVAEGHAALVEMREGDRREVAEAFREVRDLIVFVHKDLRTHIDARLGGAGASG